MTVALITMMCVMCLMCTMCRQIRCDAFRFSLQTPLGTRV